MPLISRRTIALTVALVFPAALLISGSCVRGRATSLPHAYLGFDANDYPGDAALPALRRTFSFAGYWLNKPPGGASVSWSAKREILRRDGFGFLLLFNGRLERQLKNPKRAAALGSSDATAATEAALRNGFHPGAIIFLDQEEGGEMEPNQMAYLLAWIDGIEAAHFRAGIYCSGMPAGAGADGMIITANDIRRRAGSRAIAFFVYDDACPPSSGCAISNRPPTPSQSGIPFASVWQFAQSPKRGQYTASCSATYNRDGNCDAPGFGKDAPIDLDSATSPDPSGGRR